ncbi:TRAP transporter large permease [Ferrovibrio sp.]|uniref:TRAP transporter large permease n=1 Tax=Ferrovibrio sp. TaxID=1917215 RepID=UPI0025BCBA17|nr:TRAP transporter large permease [Ferrovibrio sp.]
MTTGLILAGIIVVLILLRQNIILTLAVAVAFIHAYMAKSRPEFLIQDIWFTVDREVLLSIPMFIVAGMVMARGSIAARLTRIMAALTPNIPGGLGIATVLSLAGFSAISGSSVVTMMAIGSIMYPALLKAGYSKKFSLGLLCSGGTLGIIIPPSILMIVYGIMTEVSITDLFLAGWGPGLLLTSGLCLYSYIVNRNMATKAIDMAELATALREGTAALLMPVILLGGIYSGYFTVTESAALAVAYALLIEFFIHRELKAKDFGNILLETIKLLGSLLPLVAIAGSLNTILDYAGVPAALVNFMQGYVVDKWSMLLVVNVLLLLAGALMDEVSAIVVLAPLLHPLGMAYGFDPIHFGIITIVNLQIGYVAPPVAINLIVAMVVFKEQFGFICRSVIPFIGIMLAALLVTAVFPQLSLMFLGK